MDIVLGNYKGLKANIPYIAYTEEDVNSQIATLLSGNPVREQKTGPLAMGDTAVIDYEGFKDGVAFEGGKAEKYPISNIIALIARIMDSAPHTELVTLNASKAHLPIIIFSASSQLSTHFF